MKILNPNETSIIEFNVNGISLIRRNFMDVGYVVRTSIDLCPECINSFNKWLMEEKEDVSR